MYTKLAILFVCLVSANAALKSSGRIYIGAALTTAHMSDSGYKNTAAQQFNCMTAENEMKWDAVEGTRNRPNYGPADQLVSFAKSSGMKVRGHTLIWHAQIPSWLNGLSKNDLEAAMKKHITDEMTHFKGIYAWDVLNEIFNEDGTLRDSIWKKNFGNAFPAEAFKTAHAVDGNAKLYINDYNVEGKNRKSDGLYNLVKELKAQGVPVHGVGFQSHFSAGRIPGDFQANLKRFSDLGLDVAITELDIGIQMPATADKLQQQAKDYASVVKACLAVPRCVGITVWGVNDKYSWRTNSASLLFDDSYKGKPAVAAMEAALAGH
jgi:endo-1,4-beta-xylanase